MTVQNDSGMESVFKHQNLNEQSKRRGRPSRPMPPRIDASPDEIARVAMLRPPKKKWRYLKKHKRQTENAD